MAILPRRQKDFKALAEAVAEEIAKAAPALPAGAKVNNFTPEQLQGIGNQSFGNTFNPLDRATWIAGVPFGPALPLMPSAINPVGEDGRPEPRRWEYPVAWNIFVTETRLVPWKVLRQAAEQIDLIRRCIEVVKAKISGLEWDITFSEAASELMAEGTAKDHVRAMQDARDKYQDDITRIREFWQMPDKLNGYGFKDWLNMVLEEVLVLDALSIYPHPDMKGDLHSLTVLDGSTIKPLLDDRGMRPQNPYPAYQQMLYGFPRGEFLASADDPSLDGEFSTDELIYKVRNPRTHTPYGYGPVERCLPIADLYLRRQQWLRAEFTDGVIPDLMFTSDPTFGGTPELLRAWETILNDELAGQTEQRKRARIIPSGLTPIDNSGHSEKFSATFDEYIIKGIAGHFSVMPTEIGYSDAGSLGGSGQQQGEAESGATLGRDPLLNWLEQLLSDISYNYLGMPRELVFKFDGGRATETTNDAQRRDIEIKGGQRTLNEARAEMGLPLLDAPEADAPILAMGGGMFIVTPDGVQPLGGEPAPAEGTPEAGKPEEKKPEEKPTEEPTADNTKKEVKTFLRWALKSDTTRQFEFEYLDPITASALNRAAVDGDVEMVKSLADVVLGKALGA